MRRIFESAFKTKCNCQCHQNPNIKHVSACCDNGWITSYPHDLGESPDLFFLEQDRLAWSLKTFTDATPISSLRKLEEEIKEIEADINNGVKNPEEYADALMCLFDSAGRHGITVGEITHAFYHKLKKNKSREWVKNPDNTYSHVKK
jgi:hypothetical protein